MKTALDDLQQYGPRFGVRHVHIALPDGKSEDRYFPTVEHRLFNDNGAHSLPTYGAAFEQAFDIAARLY